MRRLPTIWFALLFMAMHIAASPVRAADRLGLDRLDQPAPPLALDAGKTLADYRGQWVVLHFWATWCHACAKEMPELDRMSRRWQDKVAFFTIAVENDDGQAARDFLQRHGIQLPSITARRSGAPDRYWSWGVPVTYFINPEGQLVARALGPRDWDTAAGDNVLTTFTAVQP